MEATDYVEKAKALMSMTPLIGVMALSVGYAAACLKAHDDYLDAEIPEELEMFLLLADKFSDDYLGAE